MKPATAAGWRLLSILLAQAFVKAGLSPRRGQTEVPGLDVRGRVPWQLGDLVTNSYWSGTSTGSKGFQFRSEVSWRPCLFIGLIVFAFSAMGSAGWTAPLFKAEEWKIAGMPPDFLVDDTAVLTPPDVVSMRVVLVGSYFSPTETKTPVRWSGKLSEISKIKEQLATMPHAVPPVRLAALVVQLTTDGAEVVKSVFDIPLPPSESPGEADAAVVAMGCRKVAVVDVDGDGVKEVVAWDLAGFHGESAPRAFRESGDEYVEFPLGLPECLRPVLAWIDCNQDDLPDAVYTGLERTAPGFAIPLPLRVYLNDHGSFPVGRIVGDGKFSAGSAQTLDIDDDGKCELLLFPTSTTYYDPNSRVKVFRPANGTLEPMERLFLGFDDFIGLFPGHVARWKIDPDGHSELLMTGMWDTMMGKGRISLLYRRVSGSSKSLMFEYDRRMVDLPDFYDEYEVADLDGDGDDDAVGWRTFSRPEDSSRLCLIENTRGVLAKREESSWLEDPNHVTADRSLGGCLPFVDENGRTNFLFFAAEPHKKCVFLRNIAK